MREQAIIEALAYDGKGRASAYALAAVLTGSASKEAADEVRAAARRAGLVVEGVWVSFPTCDWRDA